MKNTKSGNSGREADRRVRGELVGVVERCLFKLGVGCKPCQLALP